MLYDYKKHIIKTQTSVKDALVMLNNLGSDAILFVVNDKNQLIGSLTDGDVRRGLINNKKIEEPVDNFIQPNPKYIDKENYKISDIIEYKEKKFKIIPIVNSDKEIINIINFDVFKSYLPIDAVIMAGGRGERLRPLTDEKPKPLLPVGSKPIIEHNIDNLAKYGIDDFHISVRYLGDMIEDYIGDGNDKNLSIDYVKETKPLGTMGSIGLINNFDHEYILMTNSDLLTNLNYEDFFLDFVKNDADLSILSIPYKVDIPYAVLELKNREIVSLKEKPTYTYYSNGGIYLFKKSMLKYIRHDEHYNATDFIDDLIKNNHKVISYSMMGYWLDIGKHDDYEKAQIDINNINFK